MRNFVIGFLLASIVIAAGGGCALPKIIVLKDPLSTEEHVRLGQIYESQGKQDLAFRQYQAAIEQNDRHLPAWLLLGDLSFRRGAYHEAEKAFRKAISLDPGSGDSCNNLAWVYLEQGENLSKAEKLAREAIVRTPERRPYYLDTLGVVLQQQGRIEESIAALEEAVRTLPKDQPEYLAEAYRHLAGSYGAAGDMANHQRYLLEYERHRGMK